MVHPTNDLEGAEQPHCPFCGTVLRDADGGYVCGGCGYFQDVPWVERPGEGDDLPGIR